MNAPRLIPISIALLTVYLGSGFSPLAALEPSEITNALKEGKQTKSRMAVVSFVPYQFGDLGWEAFDKAQKPNRPHAPSDNPMESGVYIYGTFKLKQPINSFDLTLGQVELFVRCDHRWEGDETYYRLFRIRGGAGDYLVILPAKGTSLADCQFVGPLTKAEVDTITATSQAK